MIGQTISHYKITDKLGEGGMGVAYKAEDTKLDRTVALKFLPESLTPTEEDHKRFIREAKAAAALNHPNICTIYSIDEHDGRQFIVMEYVEGETLREKIAGGDLKMKEALDYGSRIADALAEAHEQNIIHRDIKPENIMVDTNDRLKVMDFGLAKLKHTQDITQTGSTVGTLAYMSPEQIKGEAVDRRADLFSLGVVLYEMLTGAKPFRGEHQAAMTYAIVNEDPAPISRYLPEIPEELTRFFDQVLAKDPEKRFDRAEQVRGALESVKESDEMLTETTRPAQAINELKQPSSDGDSSTISITLPGLGFGEKKIGWPGLLASLATMLAVVLFSGWWFIGGNLAENNTAAPSEASESEIADHSIAVLPFEVSGSGAEEWKDGMVTALSLNLDGAAGLRAIADRTVFAAWKQEGRPDDIGTTEALGIARDIGARYAVIGSAVQLGQDLRFGVEIREVDSGERLGQVEARGAPDSVTELTNKLTRQILGVLLERSEEAIPSVSLERITTSSVDALKAFLEGERHLRSGQYEAAVKDYEAAVAEDSTFALAYARLGLCHAWMVTGKSKRYWQKASEHIGMLPQRERRIVRVRNLRFDGRTVAAADSLRHLTEVYPDDPTTWYFLGETLFHSFVPRGLPEADSAFGRAIELDPGMAPYHHHFVDMAFSVYRDSALVARRFAQHPPSDYYKPGIAVVMDLVFGTPEQRQAALDSLGSNPPIPFALHHPTDGDLWIQVLESWEPPVRENLLIWRLAGANLLHGHIQEAYRHAEGQWAPGEMACLLAYASSLKMPVPDSLTRRYLAPESLSDESPTGRLKCTGLYMVDEGRDDAFSKVIRHLESKDGAESLVKEMRGYRAFQTGNLEEADRLWAGHNESDLAGAIWRGDLYRRLDRSRKAEGWYQAVWQIPLAHERLGMLYEQMDKPEKAAEAYRRFITAWENADPELQDRVEQARRRLQELFVSEEGTTD